MGLVGSGILLKLSCSTDDFIWLTPFVVNNPRTVIPYILCMSFVSLCSIFISLAGKEAFQYISCQEEGCYWDADRVLGFAGACCLLIVTIYLFCDWWGDDDEEEVDEKDEEFVEALVPVVFEENESFPTDKNGSAGLEKYYKLEIGENTGEQARNQKVLLIKETEKKRKKYSVCRIMTIALTNSFDDLTLQSSLILSGKFTWYHMLIGWTLGATTVVIGCSFFRFCKCFINVLEKIPLFIIIGCFTIWCFYDDLS